MSDKETCEVKEEDVQLGAAAEATVMAYHQLAMDPGKRLHLALDETCLQFLSLVIGNGDNSLVGKALTTLTALAESPECRAPMASTFGVLHCLKASVEEDNDHTEVMKCQAAELFTCLNFAYHQQRAVRRRSHMPDLKQTESAEKDLAHSDTEIEKKPGHSKDTTCNNQPNCSGLEEAVKEDKETNRGSLVKSDSIESNCSTVSLSSCSQPCQRNQDSQCHNAGDAAGGVERNKYYRDPKHRTRMITLHIKGMVTPSERASVEAALVRVRGVISLVFDLPRSRVLCRVRRVLDLSKLGSAVDALDEGLFLYQVVAKSKGEEVEIPLSTLAKAPAVDGSDSPQPGKSGSDVELPSYLPEDEDDECHLEDDPNTAVAPVGVIREAASSLFSAAASLLQQSFYW